MNEIVAGIIRHALTALGGVLIGAGYWSCSIPYKMAIRQKESPGAWAQGKRATLAPAISPSRTMRSSKDTRLPSAMTSRRSTSMAETFGPLFFPQRLEGYICPFMHFLLAISHIMWAFSQEALVL